MMITRMSGLNNLLPAVSSLCQERILDTSAEIAESFFCTSDLNSVSVITASGTNLKLDPLRLHILLYASIASRRYPFAKSHFGLSGATESMKAKLKRPSTVLHR